MATGNRIVTFEKPMEMKVNTFKFPELITPQGKKAPTAPFSRSSPPTSAAATFTSTAVRSKSPRG